MTVSLAQGGAGLGTAWGEELARKMIGEAGFESITIRRLPHDIQNCFYLVTKKDGILDFGDEDEHLKQVA